MDELRQSGADSTLWNDLARRTKYRPPCLSSGHTRAECWQHLKNQSKERSSMNMSKLRRALERGNRVVLFDKVRDPLRPGSRILYESYAVFAKFEDLAGYSVDEVCVMTGLDASFVHAVYAVYY